jgi:hypothetical protein
MMRNLFNTTTVIASIAIAIVLLFMAPKGFQMSAPDPIVATPADTVARNTGWHEPARPSQAGGAGLAGLAGLFGRLTG